MNMIPKKTAELFKKLLGMVAPPLLMTVSEWANKWRFIPDDYGAEPGRWDSNRAQYQKVIMDAFTQKGVHKVVAMLAAQLGKSEILFNVLGRFIHLDPCPILLVQPTVDDSKDWSKERLTPSVEKTPVLKELVHEQKSRNGENTILKKLFPGGYLAMVGSNAPSGLAKRSIRLLLFDEVDRFEKSAGTEGDPVDLCIKRTSNFWNYVVGLFSTPTDLKSRIYREYMLGTQEEWRHKCPNCGEYHWVTIWDMEYQYDTFDTNGSKSYHVNSVEWRCPDCGFAFNSDKMKATEQKYVVLNPNVTDVRSFRVNSFASPWLDWRDIVKEYLIAKKDPESLKVFMNTRLAELYRPASALRHIDGLMKRREKYDAELPDGVLRLTAAVDTQNNRLEYEIAGWGIDEERWGIEKGTILGVPDQQKTWDDLDTVLDRTFYFANHKGLCVCRTFIDSGGGYSDYVYAYCSKNEYKGRYAIRGSNIAGAPLSNGLDKAKGFPGLPLVSIGVSMGKQYIFQRLSEIKEQGPGYSHFPLDDSKGYDSRYFKGLLAESLQDKLVKGRIVQQWVNIAKDKRNEPLDLQVYNLACLRSTIPNWARLKASMDELFGNSNNSVPKNQAPNIQYGCIKKGVVI